MSMVVHLVRFIRSHLRQAYLIGTMTLAVCMVRVLMLGIGRTAAIVITAALVGLVISARRSLRLWSPRAPQPGAEDAATPTPLSTRHTGGAVLGTVEDTGEHVRVPAECACLVLGAPRQGKTTLIINGSVKQAPGAVLVTSTKMDVFRATATSRSRFGRVYVFDPIGSVELPAGADGAVMLRWSVRDAVGGWMDAYRFGTAMAMAAMAGDKSDLHWTECAGCLIALALYAAWLDGRDMNSVIGWIYSGNTHPESILAEAATSSLDAFFAHQLWLGVCDAAGEELKSIYTTARRVMKVYGFEKVSEGLSRTNWSPDQFVRSNDTVYVIASGCDQGLVAPLIVALVEAVRDAQYRRCRDDLLHDRQTWPPVSLILDEVANIAPIASLPAMVSEAGGQGLHVVAVLQDLAQAYHRWPSMADGFLTLFSYVLILGGIRDQKTVENISLVCGEHMRQRTALTSGQTRGEHISYTAGKTITEHKERNVPPGEISALPAGRALLLAGPTWKYVTLTPHEPVGPLEVTAWPDLEDLRPEAKQVAPTSRDLWSEPAEALQPPATALPELDARPLT